MERHDVSRDARRSNGRLADLGLNDVDSDGEESSNEASELNEKALAFLRKIHKRIRKRVYNQKYPQADQFVALQSLQEIWTSQTIRSFLEILGYAGGGNLVDIVEVGLIRTISILAHIQWRYWSKFESMFFPEGWENAVREGRTDQNLPHALSILKDDSFLGDSVAAGDFFNHQNTYLPKVIKQGKTLVVAKTRPLPFIKEKQEPIAEGGYGVVTKEVIACHHFCFYGESGYSAPHNQDFTVARKRFQVRGDFKAETKTLNMLASALSKHDRLVKHLAFITVKDDNDPGAPKEFNILLPMANTDLKQLLYQDRFSRHCNNIIHLMKEALNLVDALDWLHQDKLIDDKMQVFCHMDLKLDNILVYELEEEKSPAGCWKISDFGISSVKERRPNAQLRNTLQKSPAETLALLVGEDPMLTSKKREPGMYSAPEVHERKGMVGPPSDVWSFGCILFQVLARGIGASCLEDMDNRRCSKEHDHFCQHTDEGEAHLHVAVEKWLNSSGVDDPEHTTVQNQKIILHCKKIIKQALIVDPDTRATAADLRSSLLDVCQRDEDPSKSAPESPITTTPGPIFPLQSSSTMPLPYRKVDNLPPSGPDSSQGPQAPFLPASPPLKSSDRPSPGATGYRQPPQKPSPSQTAPPTPPDDHTASSNLDITDDFRNENSEGKSRKYAALPRDDAHLQPQIPARVSSHSIEMTAAASMKLPVAHEPSSASNSKIAPLFNIHPCQAATPLQAVASTSSAGAGMADWGGKRPGSMPGGHLSSEHTLEIPLPSLPGREAMQSTNNAGKMPESSHSGKGEDMGSTTTRKPSPLGRGMVRLSENNEKLRSLSLPLLQVQNSEIQAVNEPSAHIQRRSLATSHRPPNPPTLSGPSVLPSQYKSPYAESYHSSQSSSNGENIAPHERVPPRRRIQATTTSRVEDKDAQASTSSEAVSEPQLDPLPDEHWLDVHTQQQRARRRSGQSSVPSVNIGSTNVHTFPTISPKTTMTLVSSTAAMIAFVAPNSVTISTLYEPTCRKEIKAPSDVAWQRGSLSGKFLALRGYCERNKTWVLHFYHLKLHPSQESSGYNQAVLGCRQIEHHERLPQYDKFDVSRDGRLLLGRLDKIYLANSLVEEPFELEPNLVDKFNLQRVWFSTNGTIAFAWSTGPKNIHRVNWWEVKNPQRHGRLKHQSPDNTITADKMSLIHFPRKPLCLLSMNHDLFLLQGSTKPPAFQIPQFPLINFRKAVVTPNEDAVIFINSSMPMFKKPVSKICFCRIKKTGDRFYYLDNWSTPEPLQYHIKEPDKCEVVIEEYEGSRSDIRVLIAQCDGRFEVKDISLPPIPA